MRRAITRLASIVLVLVIGDGASAAPRPASVPTLYAATTGSTSRDSAIFQVTSRAGISVLVEEIGQAWKIVADPAGTLFIADGAGDSGDLIWRLPKGGPIEPYYIFGSTRASPYGVVTAPDGTLFVTASPDDSGSVSSIFAISPLGVATQLSTVAGQQYSLTRTGAGDFYSAGYYFSLDRIWKTSASGAAEVLIDGIADTPTDVQVGPDNALYIAVPGLNQILRWDLGSEAPTLTVFVDIPQPHCLTFDSAGYLYVGQRGAISVVDPLGVISVIATGFRDDWITGIALSCPSSGEKGKPKPCFSVRRPLTGP